MFPPWFEALPSRFPHLPIKTLQTITTMLVQQVNVPLTSSMGRLFDVVSALLGLCSIVTYEGQAAIALEQAALTSQYAGPAYSFALAQGQIKLASLLADILRDIDVDLRIHSCFMTAS